MKSLYSILLMILVYVPVSAQKITLRFEGSANATNNAVRNYLVDLDGRKYYSTDANLAVNGGARTVDINDAGLGSHKVIVYELADNSTNTTNTSDPMYSKDFQVRSGYDMVIGIRKNGQVSFSEKRTSGSTAAASSNTPMTQTAFDKQLQTVKAKWSQTSKYNAIKAAIANKSNYFTTEQVGQLLLLLTSESRRLELAKLSYPKVTDPNNFGDVSDLFTTQANKDNINKFIQSKNPEITTSANTAIDNSRPPLTTQQYNQLQRKIRNQYEESSKVAVLRDALNSSSNYFTTAQLKQLLLLIQDENDRLLLAKQSYSRVSDQTNFSSLSTVFNSQANRDDFNSYAQSGGTVVSGQSSTRTAMSNGDFDALQFKSRLHLHQSSIVSDIKKAFSNTNDYFSVDQIRSLLSMVKSETDRLMLAKLAYLRIVDPTTFTQLYDMFSSQASIQALNDYIKATALR